MTNKTVLPLEPNTTRKDYPLYSGLLSYFPHALAYVSHVSKIANDQHNPGEPLHWAREKSTDHADCLLRHLLNKGEVDEDGVRETGKVAWRALALLEEELEKQRVAVEIEEKRKTLYRWNDAPVWANWAATFSDGSVGWWKNKPKERGDGYFEQGWWGKDYIGKGNATHYLRGIESLEARPT